MLYLDLEDYFIRCGSPASILSHPPTVLVLIVHVTEKKKMRGLILRNRLLPIGPASESGANTTYYIHACHIRSRNPRYGCPPPPPLYQSELLSRSMLLPGPKQMRQPMPPLMVMRMSSVFSAKDVCQGNLTRPRPIKSRSEASFDKPDLVFGFLSRFLFACFLF